MSNEEKETIIASATRVGYWPTGMKTEDVRSLLEAIYSIYENNKTFAGRNNEQAAFDVAHAAMRAIEINVMGDVVGSEKLVDRPKCVTALHVAIALQVALVALVIICW